MEKNQIAQIVTANIKSILLEKGMQAVDLAKKCHISSATLSKIINGNQGISMDMLVALAEGLGVGVEEILRGIIKKGIKEDGTKKQKMSSGHLSIGILSINKRRFTCVKNHEGKIIGASELEGGLDLTEKSNSLINLVQQAIYAALPNVSNSLIRLKDAKINLATQSYEFEETRNKFILYAKKHSMNVALLSDWQITYLAAFADKAGISLIIDKGVSLVYKIDDNSLLKKLGGWKFPVYDLGGENWLGSETIKHTIEAAEGYIPMSKLASNVLAKFNGKLEAITEICFKDERNPDIYCFFASLLLRSYLSKDKAAKEILERGFKHIYKAITKVDSISKAELKIALSGSLADIYKPFFKRERLIKNPSEATKVKLLADITRDDLIAHGIESA